MATKTEFFQIYNVFQHDFLRSHSCTLSVGAIALYYSLLGLWNDQRRPVVFLAYISDLQLTSKLSERSVRIKRKELVDAGLIAYKEGRKNTPGQYQLANIYDIFHKDKSFESLKPFSIEDDLPGKICRENEEKPGKICRENEIPCIICGKICAKSAGKKGSLLLDTEIQRYRDILDTKAQRYIDLYLDKKTEFEKIEIPKNNNAEFFDFESLQNKWNEVCSPIPKIDMYTSERIYNICSLVYVFGADIVMSTLLDAVTTPYLRGDNQHGWKTDIDWCLESNNFLNIKQGKYKSISKSPKCNSSPGSYRPDGRNADYAENIQDDYDWFYEEGIYADINLDDGEDVATADAEESEATAKIDK